MVIIICYLGDTGIEKIVTETWYSILLSETTYESLCTSLQELISFTSAQTLESTTTGLISINQSQFKQLQPVWKTWLGLQVRGTKWIQKQRKSLIINSEKLTSRNYGYIGNVPVQHKNALKKWIDDGVFKRTQALPFIENPTLTGVDCDARYAPYSYQIPATEFPFAGWDYLQVRKFKSSSCLVTMYGDYIECILRNFKTKLSKQQINVKIILCDCMDIKEHLEEDTVFDRILTSNLMDYFFLPNLLQICSQVLNHNNHHATIITETILWTQNIMLKGNISFPSNESQMPKLVKIGLQDTKRSSFADDDGESVAEYLDNSSEFLIFLRALFYIHRVRTMAEAGSMNKKPATPFVKELGSDFQLRLRDGIRNENRIVFFKPAINRRRATILSGFERFLEWVPVQRK